MVSPQERNYPISLVQWLARAREVLDDLFSREVLPVLVGGTHLYWRALLEGFAPPEVPPDRQFRAASSLIESPFDICSGIELNARTVWKKNGRSSVGGSR